MNSLLLMLCLYYFATQIGGAIVFRNKSKTSVFREKLRFSKRAIQIGETSASILQIDRRSVYDLDQPLKAGVVDKIQGVKWESHYWIDNDGNIHLNDGSSKSVWEYIERHSGLHIKLTRIADDWGPSPETNNTLVDMLKTGEIDVSLTGLSNCCDRDKYHDFTPILLERDFVVAFYPTELENDIYFRIFAPGLWIALVFTLLLLFLVMLLFSWIGGNKLRLETHFSLLDSLSWLFCVVSQQGYTKTPATFSGKALFLVGFVMGTLLFQGFCANVITILSRSEKIDSLRALIQLQTINIYQSYFLPFQNELESSNKPIVTDLVTKIKSKDGSLMCEKKIICDINIMNQIAFQKDPKLAFVGPEAYLRDKGFFSFNEIQNLPCTLKWFKVPMGRQKMMFGIRKHLPQKKKIDIAFYRFRETGLLQKTIQTYKPISPMCESLNEFQSKVVSFQHVQGAYYLLGLGYLVSVTSLFVEKLSMRQQER